LKRLPESWKQKQRNLQERNRAARLARKEERTRTGDKEEQVKRWDPKRYENDPVKFAKEILGFNPTPYQIDFLTDFTKRIELIFPRQSGKTTIIAIRMIWYATEHPRTTSLIVAPGLRQSMIVMDRVHAFLMTIPKPLRREMLAKMQRTVIWFKNGAQLVALSILPVHAGPSIQQATPP
jgi:hypothetical protein